MNNTDNLLGYSNLQDINNEIYERQNEIDTKMAVTLFNNAHAIKLNVKDEKELIELYSIKNELSLRSRFD